MTVTYLGGRIAGEPEGSSNTGRNRRRVEVSAVTPTQLAWSDNEPILLMGAGDPEGFLYGSDQEDKIDRMAAQGGNCIYFHLIRNAGGDGGADEDPFNITGDPSSGTNAATLAQWNTWINRMEQNDIFALVHFYDDSSSPFGDGIPDGGSSSDTLSADEEAFIDDVVAALGERTNIIWVHAEEYDEAWTQARAEAFAAYLRSVDTYRRPLAYHETEGLVGSLEDSSDFDIFSCQNRAASPGPGDKDDAHSDYTTAYTNLEGKQHLAGWEVHPFQGQNATDAEVRQVAWGVIMAGASNAVIGWNLDVSSTPDIRLNQAQYIIDFFQATRFQFMTPDDSRAAGETDWAMAENADSFILYSTNAPNNLGVTALDKADYTLTWLNPIDGTTVVEAAQPLDATSIMPKPAGITSNEVAVYGIKDTI